MTHLLDAMVSWLRGLMPGRPLCLAIVRRYADANGAYVGELYMEYIVCGMSGYRMIGYSLDTLPFTLAPCQRLGHHLDIRNDFLAPMPRWTVRVGALEPEDNDSVRRMVARLPRRRLIVTIQNRFIEQVMRSPAQEDKQI